MFLSTRKAVLAAAAAFGLLALAACGGGGGGGAAPQTSRVTLPEGHSVASGSFSVPAGRSVERGGVRFSCAAGGAACAVVVDPGSGTARATGGRLTVARVQAATPAPQPASVTLPQGHTVASGSFSVAAGRSVERGGVRFSCAAGGATCAVTVDSGSGQARVTGGRLTVARIQAAQPGDGGQDGGMEEADWPFPDWPVVDVAAARSLVGGSALSWSSSDIHNRIRAFEDGGYVDPLDGAGYFLILGEACITKKLHENDCDVEYRPVMTYRNGGIPIVQARALRDEGARGVGGRPNEEIGIGGILDHGYFMVARTRNGIGGDFETERAGAKIYVRTRGIPSFDVVSTGRWQGALAGTGRSETSPLYRQFIIGDVEITVELGTIWRDFAVTFDNIRNLSTGDRNVTLSHMRWDFDNVGHKNPSKAGSIRRGTPGYFSMYFRGPNDEEVLGLFETEEAAGAFGAKKQ